VSVERSSRVDPSDNPFVISGTEASPLAKPFLKPYINRATARPSDKRADELQLIRANASN